MPKTKEEIDAYWKPLHDKLTKLYYQDKAVSKDLFDKAHTVLWLLCDQESIQNGIIPDFQDEETKKKRSTQIAEMLAVLKTTDVDNLIQQLKVT